MKFEYYDPKRLVPILRELGVTYCFSMVCPGCVYTNVPPEDCVRDRDEMKSPSVQSDSLCPHCYITAEEMGEPIHFGDDPHITKKIQELEKIIEMASN